MSDLRDQQDPDDTLAKWEAEIIAKTIEDVLAAMDNIDWDSEIEEGQNLRLLRQAVELEIKGVGDDS